jgi:hypothetical protein
MLGLLFNRTLWRVAPVRMGDDEGALVRRWREKRGEIEPEDLLGNLMRPIPGK